MKRILLSLATCTLIFGGAAAQNQVGTDANKAPAVLTEDESQAVTARKIKKSSAVTIWSEDFSGGIPATWTNAGFDVDPATGGFTPNPLCLWEYRGPNTTPSNAVGSRGAYSGSQAPIASPSTGNGFVIFDSDFLDNGGDPNNPGGGNSAAPHVGTLTTDNIDCSGYPFVQLTMSSYAREFFADLVVAVSNDGGTTFPDTVIAHDLAVNASSPNGDIISMDISNTAGNQSQVVLQFIFDGRPGNVNGNGYYFWILDDVEISDIPANSFKFTAFQGAPAHDVIYPAGHPKYGNPQEDQSAQLPITFDSNILNFGYADQTNVRLIVEIQDANTGSVVTTLQSPAKALLASGDTGSYVDFTTSSSWTPSGEGDFDAVFYVTSDSANAITPYDTISFSINSNVHAAHYSSLDNTIGIATGVLALGQSFTFPSDVDTNGYVAIDQISMYISSISDTTGSLILEVYDTTGFSYGAGGGPAGSPFTVKSYPLSASNVGQTSAIDVTTNGQPLFLPANAGYMVVVNLVANATNGDIRIGNDQTVAVTPPLIGMLFNDGNWYSGFSNSRTLSNLIINMNVVTGIGLEEALAKQNAISLYPNPSTNGQVNIDLDFGGSYHIEVTTLTGQRVHAEEITVNGGEKIIRDFSNLKKGAYLVNFTSDEINTTKKLVIE